MASGRLLTWRRFHLQFQPRSSELGCGSIWFSCWSMVPCCWPGFALST